jgi:hypothetical protein
VGSHCEDMERRPGPYARGVPHKTHATVGPISTHGIPYLDVELLDRVTSSIFSGDARFVLTGSDDGNVRIWKAKASDKLGVVTARERAAMEYRESLKDRWKMDAQVGKVARCAGSVRKSSALLTNPRTCVVGHGTYQSLCIRRQNSSGRCWMHSASKRKGEGRIRGLENRSQSLQGRRSLSWSRHEINLLIDLLCALCTVFFQPYTLVVAISAHDDQRRLNQVYAPEGR